jgi:dienelactone hydrolase
MRKISSRVIRYGRAWIVGPGDVVEEEVTIDRDGTPIPATIVRPRGMPPPLPAWVALHGITRPGRAHTQLVRFTRSVASAGMAVIVPEVPEWRELSLSPHLTVPTVAAAIQGLRDLRLARSDQVGLVGFSFGAPHAIASAAAERIRDDVAGVCGFGGYCSIEDTIRFMMCGRHAWGGTEHHLRPDPYGRWIVGANYLTTVPGHSDAGDVAQALRALARHAGDVGDPSWDPVYDPVIHRLRSDVAPGRRSLFDLFAPLSGAEVSPEPADELAEALAEGGRRKDPLIDPTEAFRRVEADVHILHGRRDHLIPFTESLRLAEALTRADSRLTVTRLFGHSSQERVPIGAALTELPAFVRALSDVLTIV